MRFGIIPKLTETRTNLYIKITSHQLPLIQIAAAFADSQRRYLETAAVLVSHEARIAGSFLSAH